ncbi:IS3 family transposase [Gottfriedia sp. S16(2024)]|uniref:IS3 family transposase n=1 Tax=Gottfriedia sp. S16(2024) TaxID=3162883 RepID=UPI003D211C3C
MAKKGQTFSTYSEEVKREVVRLKVDEGWSYRMLREKFGIKSDSQIAQWVRKVKNGETFDDQRGIWSKKNFTSIEEEVNYLKAQVEYFKKAQSKSSRKGMVLKAARFEIINQLRNFHPLKWLLKIGEVSKAGFYKWRKSLSKRSVKVDEELLLKEHILAIYKIHPYFGYKRMTKALKREGILVNHKRVRRMMRNLGIRSVIRKKRPFYGKRGSVVFPNILNRKFSAEKPYQKLVTDITYVRTGDTFVYLSTVLDLYNNEIVAWKLSERNDLELVLNTLDQLENKPFTKDALIHSDQGFQYTSPAYKKQVTEKIKIQGSHSRKGNCYDNACIESFFSHLKTEKLYLVNPKSKPEAAKAIHEYIYFYNNDRFQEKLNDLSPIEYREKVAA